MTRLLLCLLALGQPAPPALEEKLLARIPDGIELEGSPVFSPDGLAVAWVGLRGKRPHPVIGDQVLETYDYIDPPVFGPTREHLAFRVGNRTTKKTEKWWVLQGGKRTGENDWIGTPAWSPDGAQLAYWTNPGARVSAEGPYTGGKHVLVVNGKKGSAWEGAEALAPPVFSADGKQVAVIAQQGGRWFVVVNGQKLTPEPLVDSVAFSPDGKQVAYAAARGGAAPGAGRGPQVGPPAMKFVVVVGKKVFGDGEDSAGSPCYAPGGVLAYKALKGGKMGVVVGDRKGPFEFDIVGRPAFSADGRRVAYAAATGAQVDAFGALGPYAEAMAQGGRWFLVVDGKRGAGEFDRVDAPAFAPDGKQVACRARRGKKALIVIGEKAGEELDDVGPPAFAPDGKRVAFGARIGRELWWKVVPVE
jgi:hypothetical protein